MNFRNLGGLYVVQITNTVLPLLTVPYLARTLGVEGFGVLSWVFAATFLVVLASDSGINGVAIRAMVHRRGSARAVQRIFTTTQAIRLALAILSSCLLWALILSVDHWRVNAPLLALGMLNVLGTLSFPTYYYVATEKNERTALLHFAGRAVAVGLVFVLVRTRDDVAIALALQSAATLFSGLLAHLSNGVNGLPRYSGFSMRIARVLVRRARPSYLPEIQIQAMASVPVLILGSLAGSVEAGIYALCDKIARTGASLFQPILQAMLPRWAKRGDDVVASHQALLREPLLVKVAVAAVCAGAVLLAGAPVWLEIVAGPKFADMAYLSSVLRLLAVWMTLHIILRCVEVRAFVAAGRTHDYWLAMRWLLLLQWVLLVLCTYLAGALGGAFAITTCEVLFVWRLGRAIGTRQ
ncbi:MAG: oligosaccharide flippase family protein [Rhizobacter sp.]|nr:oligosaccharide flippase family protein [Burkholderiales bacterium]